KKKNNIFIPRFKDDKHVEVAGRYKGVTEINKKLYGFARKMDHEFSYDRRDPFLKPDEVKHHNLRPGLVIEGEYEEDRHGQRHIHSIEKINGRDPMHWQRSTRFELQTPIMPVDQIKLGQDPNDYEMRVIDLIAPIGKGQRALIVAPPRTGKTVLLKKIAESVCHNYPDI